MACKTGARRPLLAPLLAAMFGVVLTLTPGLHHDFACHQNSRTHCNSCLTSQSAPHVEICATPLSAITNVSGDVDVPASPPVRSRFIFSDSGRSPPA